MWACPTALGIKDNYGCATTGLREHSGWAHPADLPLTERSRAHARLQLPSLLLTLQHLFSCASPCALCSSVIIIRKENFA